jgi:hypothetical protein
MTKEDELEKQMLTEAVTAGKLLRDELVRQAKQGPIVVANFQKIRQLETDIKICEQELRKFQ